MTADVSTTCSNCNGPMYADCGGRGYILFDDADGNERTRSCPNVYRRKIANNLGPEIAGARVAKGSFLYQAQTGGPVTDYTQRNVLFRSTWPGLLPHFKWALTAKGTNYPVRIVTDTKIKTVFVGDDQYRSRPVAARDDMATYNNLDDLLGGDLALVIIKLGYLGHKNAAAAGALKEALMIRDVARKPTWVVDDTRVGYEWRHSRSPEVEDFLQQFEFVEIEPGEEASSVVERDRPGDEPLREVAGLNVEDHEAEEDAPPPTPKPKPKFRPPVIQETAAAPEPNLDAMVDGFLDGGGSKKKYKKKGGSW